MTISDRVRVVEQRIAAIEREIASMLRSWRALRRELHAQERDDRLRRYETVELVCHTAVAIVLVVAYVAVVTTGHDGDGLLALTGGYVLGVGASKIISRIGS